MQPQPKLSAEERKRLDRQRFIGLQTQKKLLNSRILITPVNGPNTELAKNLVLAGVNITIYDDAIVTEDDYQTNFLVGFDQIGKNRGQVIFQRIKQMNPTGQNEVYIQSINPGSINSQFLSKFSIVCTSFTDFNVVNEWDKLTKSCNKPYYNIFSAGLHACCYVSLGQNYKFNYKQPVNSQVKVTTQQKPSKEFNINCLLFSQSFDKQQIKKTRRKQFQMLQAITMMKQSQQASLNYDPFNPMKMHEQMLYCMIDLGQDIKEEIDRNFLIDFAKCFGIDYCPVYSVIGSIVSQEIIKVTQNQQQPAVNWIVFNSQQGYACVLKLKKQQQRIIFKTIQTN